jgi:glycogen debranching enzyme
MAVCASVEGRGDVTAASPWTFSGEGTAIGVDKTVTLVEGSTFLVSGRSGDIHEHGAQGLFMLDTRVLSGWMVLVNGRTVEPLSVVANGPFSATFVGRVDLDGAPDASIAVVQRRWVGRGMCETLEVRNYGIETIHLSVGLSARSDFHGLFDVKSGRTVGDATGTIASVPAGLWLAPDADADTAVERTVVISTVRPDHAPDGSLAWHVDVPAGGMWETCLEVGVRAGGVDIEPSHRCGTVMDESVPATRLRHWRDSTMRFETDHPALATAVRQSVDDLGALRIFDPEHPERVVIAAGAPWFMTLFGRDSIISSWMALPLDQTLARGVLAELAEAQGTSVDQRTEEQPGRILHEVRFDRMSARLLGGTGTYYGSIDSTPLFVMLVAELARWTGPTPEIAALLPAVDRALEWVERFGDRDGDGFVEYQRSDDHGLEHQGWKDSWDGIRHADGSVADTPIALSEVQGYVYAAFRGRAALARAFGESDDYARGFDDLADRLRTRFDQAFWLPDERWYSVGLDRDKAPIRSLTSNIGHLLWTGIVPQRRAERLAELLISPALHSGWGVRTLASDAAGYNPLSYHRGSVWPHDTAIAIAGLARYRCDTEAQVLAMALIDASMSSQGRLPELFGGFDRTDLEAPVPYPASCSPQAWAAASTLLVVRALLGLEPDLIAGRVHLRPRLPSQIARLRLARIPLGDRRLTVDVHGDEVDVHLDDPSIEVVVERDRTAGALPSDQQ